MKKAIAALCLAPALFVAGYSAATAAGGGILEGVMNALKVGSEAGAIQQLNSYRAARGVTPDYLEALSWLARAELLSKRYAQAEQFAQQTYDLTIDQLKRRPLDQEPHLPIALGAAIEVEGGVLASTGRRSEAVTYLQTQEKTFAATSIRTRIQKNLLLLTLEGKPAPPLEKIVLPKGHPALLFFWAHWCPDCKSEIPILRQIKTEFVPRGLAFLAPTQKYGYVAGGADAPPSVEVPYIEQVRKMYYSGVIDGPPVISEANFTRYGASTTPTIVLVDGAGIVRLYHPGAMTYADLRAAIARVL